MIHLRSRRWCAAALLLLAGLPGARPAVSAQEASGTPSVPGLTLERIMADPDWIGNAPEKPYWADDGRAVYFEQKRQGSPLRDLYRLPLGEREPRLVAGAQRGAADAPEGDVSRDRRWKVYAREGDVFWKDLGSGAIR